MKNFHDNIFYTMLDDKVKTKDNINARYDMEKLCSQSGGRLFLIGDGQVAKPKVVYTIFDDYRIRFCQWVKDLKLPDGFASNISKCVNMTDCKFSGLKSHDCHVMLQRLLPIGLRGMLPNHVWDALVEVSIFFRDISASTLRRG